MMSARNERHALLATLWFAIAHYCLRPWPWIVVALASLVLYPDIADRESGYALVMRDHLPAGWRGLLVGAFAAAYMSTVSTQLNWGTSYLVNDFYARFVRARAGSAELVAVSRAVTVGIMLLSGALTFRLESVRQAWEFALESGAGIGLVLILRWYWWRVNAVSEIAALLAAAVGFAGLRLLTTVEFPQTLLYLVPWTTAWWLAATWLTPPEPMSHLVAFYRAGAPRRTGLGAGGGARRGRTAGTPAAGTCCAGRPAASWCTPRCSQPGPHCSDRPAGAWLWGGFAVCRGRLAVPRSRLDTTTGRRLVAARVRRDRVDPDAVARGTARRAGRQRGRSARRGRAGPNGCVAPTPPGVAATRPGCAVRPRSRLAADPPGRASAGAPWANTHSLYRRAAVVDPDATRPCSG